MWDTHIQEYRQPQVFQNVLEVISWVVRQNNISHIFEKIKVHALVEWRTVVRANSALSKIFFTTLN